MLTLQPMQPQHLTQVAELNVADEQVKFVGTIDEILVNIDDKIHPHLMLADGQVVGFFLIDTLYSQQYDFAGSHHLGLRAFFVSQQAQGNGYGKQAARLLKEYLQRLYPQFHRIYLTVNCKNPGARHCYLGGGFEDTGETYLGGAAGPQHIMQLDLS
ncbi:GNAT family N-acetyltransferase [Vibrio fluvialis]|uniref:GNAT family N-acetyltransferase n=1 Tax=Vibrio fluvialis TaxID=676 RepID=UPI00192BAB2B|nr:GNAT family N-acetyltransferase [Vibrio fluvialis]MBY8269817.1 GNAT family N-acetyltransferase [Vibrio fluvialis]